MFGVTFSRTCDCCGLLMDDRVVMGEEITEKIGDLVPWNHAPEGPALFFCRDFGEAFQGQDCDDFPMEGQALAVSLTIIAALNEKVLERFVFRAPKRKFPIVPYGDRYTEGVCLMPCNHAPGPRANAFLAFRKRLSRGIRVGIEQDETSQMFDDLFIAFDSGGLTGLRQDGRKLFGLSFHDCSPPP